jgi:hypothetical protein
VGQVAAYLTKLAPQPRPLGNNCATVEGLVAAMGALERSGADTVLSANVRERISGELTKSLSMQVQSGQTRVTFGPDRFYEDPKLGNFAGGFLDGGAELTMRIDTTQHCLSALTSYAQAVAR